MHSLETEEKNKLIEHMSKEIETLSTSALTFRTKSAFTIWIGPYFILGSVIVATKAKFKFTISNLELIGISLFVIYVLLGGITGWIERHYWKRCNELRKGIIQLLISDEKKKELANAILLDNINVNRMIPAYLVLFFLIALSFLFLSYVTMQISSC